MTRASSRCSYSSRKSWSLCCLSAARPHALLQLCPCPALALLTPTLSCPLNFPACLENFLMAAASPGSCWTVTNPGPQPWNQPSLSLAYWVVVGLCLMGEDKGGYSPAGLWAPAAPPGLCPVARTDPDTYLLEELFVWACPNPSKQKPAGLVQMGGLWWYGSSWLG